MWGESTSGFTRLLLRAVNAISPLRRLASKIVINKLAYATPNRPRPFSMAAPYTTWRGLTDRRYSGRHLPPAPDYTRSLPDLDAVAGLFERTEDRRATDTSLLFPFFAQWFTDSFLRTKWKEPDKQDFAENESNHDIDLCQIYGVAEEQTNLLREHSGGRLKSQRIDGEEYPAPLFEEKDGAVVLRQEFEGLYSGANFGRVFANASDEHRRNCFAVGLEHGNSTLGNTVMNTLFLREHNRVAAIIAAAHPDWDDERVFQTTRNVLIVELLKIVVGDYIVHIAPVEIRLEIVPGTAEKEHWYRTNWIAVEFALLYRWHDLIPETVKLGGRERPAQEAIHRNNRILRELGLDRICMDASRTLAGRIGLRNTPDFLQEVKKTSIGMARTCELASYNDYREYYGLSRVENFEDLAEDPATVQALRTLYGDIDRVEWFVGIFAEDYSHPRLMGELLTVMVGNDAFTQALTNPLLSERVYNAETFSPEGLEIIDATATIGDVISRNTGIEDPEKVGFKIRS